MRGTVYFLANASDIIQKAALQVDKTTLEEFLDLQVFDMQITGTDATKCHADNSVARVLQFGLWLVQQTESSMFDVCICKHNIFP